MKKWKTPQSEQHRSSTHRYEQLVWIPQEERRLEALKYLYLALPVHKAIVICRDDLQIQELAANQPQTNFEILCLYESLIQPSKQPNHNRTVEAHNLHKLIQNHDRYLILTSDAALNTVFSKNGGLESIDHIFHYHLPSYFHAYYSRNDILIDQKNNITSQYAIVVKGKDDNLIQEWKDAGCQLSNYPLDFDKILPFSAPSDKSEKISFLNSTHVPSFLLQSCDPYLKCLNGRRNRK